MGVDTLACGCIRKQPSVVFSCVDTLACGCHTGVRAAARRCRANARLKEPARVKIIEPHSLRIKARNTQSYILSNYKSREFKALRALLPSSPAANPPPSAGRLSEAPSGRLRERRFATSAGRLSQAPSGRELSSECETEGARESKDHKTALSAY